MAANVSVEIPEHTVEYASHLWREGYKMGEIVAKTGMSLHHLKRKAYADRASFPLRWFNGRRFCFYEVAERKPDELPEGRMRWVTEQGATVTLPKISLIQCPRAAA